MLLMPILLLSTFPHVQSSAVFCPDTSDLNTDQLLIGCLGVQFSWLYAVFDNLPSVLRFAVWMRCETGVCPAELQEHRHHCRYTPLTQPPADPLDRCCLQHRRCFQELEGRSCRQTPPTHTSFTCDFLTNSSCDSLDLCEEGFCLCNQEAIACIANSSQVQVNKQQEKSTAGLPYNDTITSDAFNRTALYATENETLGNFTDGFSLVNDTVANYTLSPGNSERPAPGAEDRGTEVEEREMEWWRDAKKNRTDLMEQQLSEAFNGGCAGW
ncbi:hypothetical protein SRHO_G00242000 [Serrasalmus rhombeus]